MISREFKGVWIPREIWLNNKLSITERAFLAEIDSLENQDGCYASNAHFAEFSGLSSNRCSEIITKLAQNGLITCELIRNTDGSIEKRILRVVGKPNTPPLGKPTEPTRKTEGGYSEKAEGTNTRKRDTRKSNTDNPLPLEPDLSNFTESEQKAIEKWFSHKKERKQTYKPIGKQALITELSNEKSKGCNLVQAIESTIAKNWSGIVYEKGYQAGRSPTINNGSKLIRTSEQDYLNGEF